MKWLCKFLLGVIRFFLFFYMMLSGFGLTIKSAGPIVLYYSFWFVSLVIHETIEKIEEKKDA